MQRKVLQQSTSGLGYMLQKCYHHFFIFAVFDVSLRR